MTVLEVPQDINRIKKKKINIYPHTKAPKKFCEHGMNTKLVTTLYSGFAMRNIEVVPQCYMFQNPVRRREVP